MAWLIYGLRRNFRWSAKALALLGGYFACVKNKKSDVKVPFLLDWLKSTASTNLPWNYGIWATAWQNQQNDRWAQRRLIRVFAVHMKLGSLATHWAHSEDWSDWADARSDLSLCRAHRSFCWFCHAAAHIAFQKILFEPNTAKSTKWYWCSAKAQISLQINFLLYTWIRFWSLATHKSDKRRLWSNCAAAQADLNLCGVHIWFWRFCCAHEIMVLIT